MGGVGAVATGAEGADAGAMDWATAGAGVWAGFVSAILVFCSEVWGSEAAGEAALAGAVGAASLAVATSTFSFGSG